MFLFAEKSNSVIFFVFLQLANSQGNCGFKYFLVGSIGNVYLPCLIFYSQLLILSCIFLLFLLVNLFIHNPV